MMVVVGGVAWEVLVSYVSSQFLSVQISPSRRRLSCGIGVRPDVVSFT